MRIVNTEGFPYEPLGLQAHDTAYLWAGKTNRHRAFAVFRIDQRGQATGISRAYRGLTCQGRDETSSNVHVVPKNSCEHGRTRRPLYFHSDIMHASVKDVATPPTSPNQLGPLHNQGVWFSCTGGCCQATTFGPY